MIKDRGSWPYGFLDQQITYLYVVLEILYFLVLPLDFLHTFIQSIFTHHQEYVNTIYHYIVNPMLYDVYQVDYHKVINFDFLYARKQCVKLRTSVITHKLSHTSIKYASCPQCTLNAR